MKPTYLSSQQLEVLNMMSNLVGKRVLPCLMYTANPTAMMQWQFNLCRQTSILLNALIKELLQQWDLYEYYDVQSWDGTFQELSTKKLMHPYNHAWVYLQHCDDVTKNILVDVARVEANIPVSVGAVNEPTWLLSHPTNGNSTKELSRQQLDYWAHIAQPEYYTQRPARETYLQLRATLGLYDREFTRPLRSGVIVPPPACLV